MEGGNGLGGIAGGGRKGRERWAGEFGKGGERGEEEEGCE